jgi:hypothetical protein
MNMMDMPLWQSPSKIEPPLNFCENSKSWNMEQTFIAQGLTPRLMRLDNEASQLLKDYLYEKNISSFHLVPSNSHCRNAAERAIRSFKVHLIAALISTEKSFLMHLCDRLLPHAVIILNIYY